MYIDTGPDPFGNYLCQKLLEYADDHQRTVLVMNAAPELPTIALNQHGTRALQKMIDCISTPEQVCQASSIIKMILSDGSYEQVQTIIRALERRVVELIQDINGNHVIQKCLNRLTSVNAEVASFSFSFSFHLARRSTYVT